MCQRSSIFEDTQIKVKDWRFVLRDFENPDSVQISRNLKKFQKPRFRSLDWKKSFGRSFGNSN